MNKSIKILTIAGATVCGLIWLATSGGCNTATSTAAGVDTALLEKSQSQFVATEEPADPEGVEELFARMNGTDDTEGESGPIEVTLLGRVGGKASKDHPIGSDFPWDSGKAVFVISDPSAAGAESTADSSEHDHDEHAGHEHGEHDGHDHDGDDHDGHDHDAAEHGHAAESKSAHKDDCPCPFCANGKEAPIQAIVQFSDDSGSPIQIDARKLFDLMGDEIIVVKGTANLTVGMLMIDAKQIHVRR